MSEHEPSSPPRRRTSRKKTKPPSPPPPIICPKCSGPIVTNQRVAPVSTGIVWWSEHPVLSRQPSICLTIPTDGSPGRSDLSLHDQLRQRAAMGGELERAQLEGFEGLWTDLIVKALLATLEKDAETQGVGIWTLLAREADKT